MDIGYWDTVFDSLDTWQLRQLRETIDERLLQRELGVDTGGQLPLDAQRATFYSDSLTLYRSGRSTPTASSSRSGKTTSFLPITPIDNPNHLPVNLDGVRLIDATPHSDRLSLRQKTLQKSVNDSRTGEIVQRQYFCTFCAELDEEKIIKTKQYWKRHEEDYHNGTGLEWTCPINHCTSVFRRGCDFKQHLKKDHQGKKYSKDCKEVHQLPYVYACGFEHCRQLNRTWKDHCDHVAVHMAAGLRTWTYDWTIRNLLKHDKLKAQWKHTYTTLCPQVSVPHSTLTWDIQTTRHMREQLESHSFPDGLGTFLQKLFISGLAPGTAKNINMQLPFTNVAPPWQQTEPPILPPLLPSSVGFFDVDTVSYGVDLISPKSLTAGTEVLPPSNNRYSTFMTDAPPLENFDTFGSNPATLFGEVPSMANEQISLGNFMTEIASPLPTHDDRNQTAISGHTRSHSARALVAKSSRWLASKKSQHFPSGVTDHTDLPVNTRIPTSPPRRKTGNIAPRMHGYQS